ncbi:carboxymuconolactone decarboxylase family protein [Legionella spiritensis]|uniref:Alkyl hydroperoxide reductase AhpD n=1 Tax=Legionella spiritensis TaxID=452 RepID=A0A0W0ZAD9_LEGSP|nr:carboxymuconolactone decarboxylase family protein [Legionella spiritensis]KTD66087.1 alkylhydroperoxidase [Legionella spiritensis]SNV44271.1 alkylhydroperoxidase [Legionella spiritensis]VEG90777.1 alkylhydroperoxidase [Legionella spiritensis]
MVDFIKEKLPEFARDARINLTKVLDVTQTDGLTEEQIIGSALAVAYHLGDDTLIAGLIESVGNDTIRQAAKVAASLMAMNNIYYRFVHLSELAELGQVPTGLRMQGMMNSGTDKVTFEIMCLAVSGLNGCGACISAHSRQLLEHGLPLSAIARIGKISAVLHAVHVSLHL